MADPSTDSKQCKLMLDPEFDAAVEERRGTKTRPAFIIEMAAKGMGLTNYKPRGRGQPKKRPSKHA